MANAREDRQGGLMNRGVDVVPLVIGQQITLWLRDLEDSMGSPPPEGQEDHDSEETFTLYKKSLKVVEMANAFLPYVPSSSSWTLTFVHSFLWFGVGNLPRQSMGRSTDD